MNFELIVLTNRTSNILCFVDDLAGVEFKYKNSVKSQQGIKESLYNQSSRLQRPDSWILRLVLKIYHNKSIKMGQVLACCTVNEKEANDDTIYCPSSQEIEQPWKERIKTNESKVVLAMDPNFTEEEIAQERMKILTSI